MIEIPKHVLRTACYEAEIEEDDIDWTYTTGYDARTHFSFLSEEGVASLAKMCTVLGSMTEVEEPDIDLHVAMSLAQNATPMNRGRRHGFYFPGVKVTA